MVSSNCFGVFPILVPYCVIEVRVPYCLEKHFGQNKSSSLFWNNFSQVVSKFTIVPTTMNVTKRVIKWWSIFYLACFIRLVKTEVYKYLRGEVTLVIKPMVQSTLVQNSTTWEMATFVWKWATILRKYLIIITLQWFFELNLNGIQHST